MSAIISPIDHVFAECAREERFPVEIWDAMVSQGLLGLGVPEELGRETANLRWGARPPLPPRNPLAAGAYNNVGPRAG